MEDNGQAQAQPQANQRDQSNTTAGAPGANPGVGAASSSSAAGGEGETGSPSTKKMVPSLPEEPPEGAPGVVKVSFRLLDGARRGPARVFSEEHTIGRLITIAAHYSDLEEGDVDLVTSFPKRSLRGLGLETTIKEADVAGDMLAIRRMGD